MEDRRAVREEGVSIKERNLPWGGGAGPDQDMLHSSQSVTNLMQEGY